MAEPVQVKVNLLEDDVRAFNVPLPSSTNSATMSSVVISRSLDMRRFLVKALENAGWDIFSGRPRPSRARLARAAVGALVR